MNWKNKVFENFRLNAVTDMTPQNFGAYVEKVDAAYRGGADIVQLRAKLLPDGQLLEIGRIFRRLSERYQKLFFVNDRLDIALALKADGLHLGQEDMPLAVARRLAKASGAELKIGKSTHSLKQALQAEKEGADYLALGPLYATPTKPDYRAVGLDLIGQVRDRIRIPFVVIGGIDCNTLPLVLDAGARRVAVVRAIFSADDPEQAARRIRNEIESHETAGV